MRAGVRAAILLLLVCCVGWSACWTKEDHEIFRLKDEVQASEGSNATFYSFMGLKQNANQDDINKAYRKLSRSLHPDKARSNWLATYNVPKKPKTKSGAKPTVHVQKDKKPSQSEINRFNKEANARFERLSLVTNILRGPERARYDHFLLNGFPAWRGTGYYYQRFRPGLGTVLAGLFVFVGGGVHYAALYLSWKRQREFVERYIKHARRTAWGDEGGIGAIPGLGGPTNANGSVAQQSIPDSDESMQWNRKQKRAMEKEKKKEGKNPTKNAKAAEKARTSGISTPVEAEITSGPVGAKKRTVAENGKVLIVDSVGNVFLEEETEEGVVQEFLLDVSIVKLKIQSSYLLTSLSSSRMRFHLHLLVTHSSSACPCISTTSHWAGI
jgi:curved DNA-binding protein CbpA